MVSTGVHKLMAAVVLTAKTGTASLASPAATDRSGSSQSMPASAPTALTGTDHNASTVQPAKTGTELPALLVLVARCGITLT